MVVPTDICHEISGDEVTDKTDHFSVALGQSSSQFANTFNLGLNIAGK